MDKDDIDVLKKLADHLKALLERPEPGLCSWNNAVRTTIRHIADYEE